MGKGHKKDGSIHKKRKKMEVSIIKEGRKKTEIYIKKMEVYINKKRWMKDKRWIKDGNRPSVFRKSFWWLF